MFVEVGEEVANLRDYLESLRLYLKDMGCGEEATEIKHPLWPIVGLLKDGTKIQFEYDRREEGCGGGPDGFCDCEEVQ
jgi:hypothetical protein